MKKQYLHNLKLLLLGSLRNYETKNIPTQQKTMKHVTFTLQVVRLMDDKHPSCDVLGRSNIIYKYSYPKYIT